MVPTDRQVTPPHKVAAVAKTNSSDLFKHKRKLQIRSFSRKHSPLDQNLNVTVRRDKRDRRQRVSRTLTQAPPPPAPQDTSDGTWLKIDVIW